MPLSEDHLLITLRSSCQQLGATHVAHAVPVTTSRMWNSLPVSTMTVSSLTTFHQEQRTFLAFLCRSSCGDIWCKKCFG